jgi:2-methylcitrate dehydratase PrpD
MIRQIATVLSQVHWTGLSAAAQQKLKLCMLADLSVAVAGRPYCRLPVLPVHQGAQFTFGSGGAASAAEAAFINAAMMHARNQDDFHPEARGAGGR